MTRTIDRTLVRFTIAQLRALHRDRSGAALVWFALTVPVLLGMAGVGVDAALWFMDRRIGQTASDSGAIAGAHAMVQGGTKSEVIKVVETEIARNDFIKSADDLVTINMPPKFGANAGTAGFIEVIIDKRRPLYFARFFHDGPAVIQTRAVSGQRPVTSEHCVLALDQNIDAALSFSGTADANIHCSVGANSKSDEAVDLNGGAMVDVDAMAAYGDISVSNNATLITDTPPQPYSDPIVDPYADLEVPADSACDHEPLTEINTDTTLEPGRYCGGISISGGAAVTFNPGVYIIDAGDFLVNGNSSMKGEGVTFILTADDPAEIGNIKFNGGTVADLTAPSDPDDYYVGVLFYQDRRVAASLDGSKLINNSFQGGAEMNLKGAIYFPKQRITYTGGAEGGSGCIQLIGGGVSFAGNANVLNGADECESLGIKKIQVMRVALVE